MNLSYQAKATKKIKYNDFELDYQILRASDALPSKGKFYPDDYVYVRGLRFREQLEAMQIQDIKDVDIAYKTVHRLHQRCVYIEGVEPDNILNEDMAVLSLWVTILTRSAMKFKIDVICPSCEHVNSYPIKVADVQLDDFELFEPQTLDTELGKLIIAPATIKEDEELVALGVDLKALNHASMIKKLNGKDLNMEERVNTLGMLSLEEARKVITVCQKFTSGMQPIENKCKNCQALIKAYPQIDVIKGLP